MVPLQPNNFVVKNEVKYQSYQQSLCKKLQSQGPTMTGIMVLHY